MNQKNPGPTTRPATDISEEVAKAQRAILATLSECEKKLATLYAIYAQSFFETSGFWEALSKEELGHAAMVLNMEQFLAAGHHFANIGVLARGAESMARELDREISMAKRGFVKEQEAFNCAIGMESSMLDSHFYDVVTCEAKAYQKMSEVLRKGCEMHRNKIRDRMVARRKEVGASWEA